MSKSCSSTAAYRTRGKEIMMEEKEKLLYWKEVLTEISKCYRAQRSVGNVIQNIDQELQYK